MRQVGWHFVHLVCSCWLLLLKKGFRLSVNIGGTHKRNRTQTQTQIANQRGGVCQGGTCQIGFRKWIMESVDSDLVGVGHCFKSCACSQAAAVAAALV